MGRALGRQKSGAQQLSGSVKAAGGLCGCVE